MRTLVKERLGQDEGLENGPEPNAPAPLPPGSGRTPTAFLSYATEDSDLARDVADALMAQGVDTWWAGWCIGAGDSIR